ncbi:MAG TPA: hypothetical protein VGK16_11810 [Candidatus Limnocylindrales bacterium]|jgi:hypothetical protein
MDWLIVTIVTALTAPIPFLASSGLLLAGFGLLWVGFAAAAVRVPDRLEAAWGRLRSMPLPVQALAWLLLLPVLAGLWVWRSRWPLLGRSIVVASIATWNLLVLLPA